MKVKEKDKRNLVRLSWLVKFTERKKKKYVSSKMQPAASTQATFAYFSPPEELLFITASALYTQFASPSNLR